MKKPFVWWSTRIKPEGAWHWYGSHSSEESAREGIRKLREKYPSVDLSIVKITEEIVVEFKAS